MLPKVATHILHHTSRAVTAVQNQTGYTIRNVLQLQTQSSTSPATTGSGLGGYGSSSWGSAGAGPGGSKYHAGSRFYTGYSVSPPFTLIRYPTWFSNWKKWAFRTQVFQYFFFFLENLHILPALNFHLVTYVLILGRWSGYYPSQLKYCSRLSNLPIR